MLDKNKYLTLLAKTISIIGHPIFIFVYILFGLLSPFFTNSLLRAIGNQIIIYTIIYFIVCILLLVFVYKRGYIQTITLSHREDRLVGYSCFFFPMLVLTYLIPKTQPLITILLLLLIWSLGVIAFVNLFWKMSAHLYFYGTALGFLLYIFIYYHLGMFVVFPCAIATAGVLAWARLYLNAHSPAQVYVGFVAGLLQPFILFPIFL
ncbi:MAG: hypothetical protein J5606_07990 [Bacteroidales bacterium]|nr:hypothetical protein [Bacteroidales bacterium]